MMSDTGDSLPPVVVIATIVEGVFFMRILNSTAAWLVAWARAVLCLLLAVMLPAPALHAATGTEEPPTIEWYMIDLPPIQISSGALRGQGYTDVIRWRLIAGLTGYRHVLRMANVQRILADIKTKPNVCNPAFMRTPQREQFMVYSDPLHAQFPNGAVIVKSRREALAPFITADGALKIADLVSSGNGTIVVQSGRSYGVMLDGVLQTAQEQQRVVTLTSGRPVAAKLGLVDKGRVELALLYPYELAFHLASSRDLTQYEFLPVEGNGAYTLNYLACSRSPLGERVITEANPIIAAERDAYFSAAYRVWIPESILKLHATHHQQAFGSPLRAQALKVPAEDSAISTCLMDGGAWYQGKCEPDQE
jgi:uncharacterized protein (TIGR02285 family)